jgi:hypothetical protein
MYSISCPVFVGAWPAIVVIVRAQMPALKSNDRYALQNMLNGLAILKNTTRADVLDQMCQ